MTTKPTMTIAKTIPLMNCHTQSIWSLERWGTGNDLTLSWQTPMPPSDPCMSPAPPSLSSPSSSSSSISSLSPSSSSPTLSCLSWFCSYSACLRFQILDSAILDSDRHVYPDIAVTVPILVILLALWLELRSDNDDDNDDNDKDDNDYDDCDLNHDDDVQVVMPGFPVQTLGSHQPPPYSPSRYKGWRSQRRWSWRQRWQWLWWRQSALASQVSQKRSTRWAAS